MKSYLILYEHKLISTNSKNLGENKKKKKYLARNIRIIRQRKVPIFKHNTVLSTILVENLANCHQQSNSSIVAFTLQAINLQKINKSIKIKISQEKKVFH